MILSYAKPFWRHSDSLMTHFMTRTYTSKYALFLIDEARFRYAATRGLLWSHMGWIFFKSKYERMETIDRDDLEGDMGNYLRSWNFIV